MLQINKDHLLEVLKAFYTLTHIRIVVFDSDFRELLSYPPQRTGFCGALRQDPAQEACCIQSDRTGCLQCLNSASTTFYRCHAGLTEAVTPILDSGGILGYVMFGQVFPRENYGAVKARMLRKYPQMEKEIQGISVKSPEELNAAATVLQALTAYVLHNHWVTPGKSEFVRRTEDYVKQHLQQSIKVEDLCQELHLRRTQLYSLSMTYLGCAPAEYVRSQRIEHARRLLVETDCPIMDIAYSVGFSDYNHFSKVFKKMTGLSARAYRQEHGQAQP